MAPFPFQRVPTELKAKIIRHHLPGIIVPESRTPDSVIALGERAATHNLKNSCTEIREIVRNIRPLEAINLERALQFSFDPNRDTLMVWNMCLPRMYYHVEWSHSNGHELCLDDDALPIRRLLACSRYPMLPENVDPTGDLADIATAAHYSIPAQPWRAIPFMTSLPILARFPRIQEFVLSIQIAPFQSWHIDGFQMLGPDVVAPRKTNETWGQRRVRPDDPQAAEYFLSRGIIADTGLEWKFPTGVNGDEWDSISDITDLGSSRKGFNGHPRIGFHGYSRGTMSLGGKWAGFRYYIETEEVEFSPLAWSEVKYFVYRLYAPEGSGMYLPDKQHPQLISRVWIIRPNERVEPEEQPHHCWIKAKEWKEGDPEWVRQLEITWKMIRGTLLRRRVEDRYSFIMHQD